MLRKAVESENLYSILGLTPYIFALVLYSLYTVLKEPFPEKADLFAVDGVIVNLGNSSGTISYQGVQKEIEFPCICDYGWGYKSFGSETNFKALVYANSDDELYAWDLVLNDTPIFTFEELRAEREPDRNERIMFGMFLLGGTSFGLVGYITLYFLRRKSGRGDEQQVA